MSNQNQNQHQQGKQQPQAQNATQGNPAPATAPTGGDGEPIERATVAPLTAQQRAKNMVQGALEYFEQDTAAISHDVSNFITAEMTACPKEELAAFRVEGRKRAERLKQFADLLFNEFTYQMAGK